LSRPRIRLPLPSACSGCGTAIHAIRNSSKEKLDPADRIIWVHDAPIAATTRKGGSHAAAPDPKYKPQRARIINFPFHPGDPTSGGFSIEASLLA
jgi:hypothetical protein